LEGNIPNVNSDLWGEGYCLTCISPCCCQVTTQ
jgi:hypothetical protein